MRLNIAKAYQRRQNDMPEEDRTVGETVEGHVGKLTGHMKVVTVPDQKDGCRMVQKQHYWNWPSAPLGQRI